MADQNSFDVGQKIRVTSTFEAEWLHDIIRFDDGLHHRITVPEGAEGIVLSTVTPYLDGNMDVHFPNVHGWPEFKDGGVRVQTSGHNVAAM